MARWASGNEKRPCVLSSPGWVREAFMILRSGPWLDYEPIGFVVLLVGILAMATLAVGY